MYYVISLNCFKVKHNISAGDGHTFVEAVWDVCHQQAQEPLPIPHVKQGFGHLNDGQQRRQLCWEHTNLNQKVIFLV